MRPTMLHYQSPKQRTSDFINVPVIAKDEDSLGDNRWKGPRISGEASVPSRRLCTQGSSS